MHWKYCDKIKLMYFININYTEIIIKTHWGHFTQNNIANGRVKQIRGFRPQVTYLNHKCMKPNKYFREYCVLGHNAMQSGRICYALQMQVAGSPYISGLLPDLNAYGILYSLEW